MPGVGCPICPDRPDLRVMQPAMDDPHRLLCECPVCRRWFFRFVRGRRTMTTLLDVPTPAELGYILEPEAPPPEGPSLLLAAPPAFRPPAAPGAGPN